MDWITPEWVNSWGGAIALLVSFALGAAAFAIPIWKFINKTPFHLAAVGAMALGVVLMSSYKWADIAVQSDAYEARISNLMQESDTSTKAIAEVSGARDAAQKRSRRFQD